MRVVVFGNGTVGSEVRKSLENNGHEVVTVSLGSGEYRADMLDSMSLHNLFSTIGSFDGVAVAKW